MFERLHKHDLESRLIAEYKQKQEQMYDKQKQLYLAEYASLCRRTKSVSDAGSRLYSRSMKTLEAKKLTVEAIKREREEVERRNYTFQP